MKKGVYGKILENLVNSRPNEGGVLRKASYCAHEDVLYKHQEDANRSLILQENAELYKQRKGRYNERRETAGEFPMSIPPTDYADLYEANPWLKVCDMQTRTKFFKKLYREHPEYRIG
jgi:hypothetical protein